MRLYLMEKKEKKWLCNSTDKNQATIDHHRICFAVAVMFVLDYYAYTQVAVTKHMVFN